MTSALHEAAGQAAPINHPGNHYFQDRQLRLSPNRIPMTRIKALPCRNHHHFQNI